MQTVNDLYSPPRELVLGTQLKARVPGADQMRQRAEVEEILRRLRRQPGVILADDVGMGKTFVALAVAYSVAVRNPLGPVIVMVPANLVDKWVQDLGAFCELYLDSRRPVQCGGDSRAAAPGADAVRYNVARHSLDLMRLMDDPPEARCHMIFLAQGAMSRRQSDKWIKLHLIAEALRRHGQNREGRLAQVRRQIHRFLAELIWAIGEERAHDWKEELWQKLLQEPPSAWMGIYNGAVLDERKRLPDDPVPGAVLDVLPGLDLTPLAAALEKMPVVARGGEERVSQRLKEARDAMRRVEQTLWSHILARAGWRSPLLVMDEAHHLKNPKTSLARQLQTPDAVSDLRTGDGAMARTFDRMLFLTATPFQLGHRELVRVLERFGDVRWDANELGPAEAFAKQMEELSKKLDDSQRAAIRLQQAWSRLCPEDCDGPVEDWWQKTLGAPHESLNDRLRAVVAAYAAAKSGRDAAQQALQTWIVRHNKGALWAGTDIQRRRRMAGAAIAGLDAANGLPIPPQQLLPFFLAARSTATPEDDLLGEALCSSYEAFRSTRQSRREARDEQDDNPREAHLPHAGWYLEEFDRALQNCSGAAHPKVEATVRRAVDLWEAGEKVLVFAFYRYTVRCLRIHISREIERRIILAGKQKLQAAGRAAADGDLEALLGRIQRLFFDDADSPGRRAVDKALGRILEMHRAAIERARMDGAQRGALMDIMRRFLRVPTTLVRFFPLAELDAIAPDAAVQRTLECADGSGLSWLEKMGGFIGFLTERCSPAERELYLEAAGRTQTGEIRVQGDAEEDPELASGTMTVANVKVAMGATRREARARLMRAFNTPFFPDILVCSQVMGEGVDLQRYCRHVIHHDLAWNPSTIEQRTGRIDRIGCKAEGRQPIVVYLPYLAGTADERQYRVMSDREQWFRVVMGQDEVARLITADSICPVRLPEAISNTLSFNLGCEMTAGHLHGSGGQ